MRNGYQELTQRSAAAGRLCLEQVPGKIAGRGEPENSIELTEGSERTMYVYAPQAGCPDAKQCQVMFILRQGADLESAKEVMDRLSLAELAEEHHVLLLFPNPLEGGWRWQDDAQTGDDIDFLLRCFASLRSSKTGINAFNGMRFYVADGQAASALLMTMAARKPLHVPAMMLGAFPTGYRIPADALNVEVSAWCGEPAAVDYLKRANRVDEASAEVMGEVTVFRGGNPNVRLLVSESQVDRISVSQAWDLLFSETRRWQNDTYGTYQARVDFAARGFVGHVEDTSLGCNNGFAHTWYEYIPPVLRGTSEPVPLLFYFHGGGCVPLYGAEQSCWHDVADRENFIVVYPQASTDKVWNAWNDSAVPSDVDFVMALIEHMKTVHPIDQRRIYISGFSMGGMMSNALAAACPDVFAAAAPCNAYHEGYFHSYAAMRPGLGKGGKRPEPKDEPPSPIRLQADRKKDEQDYRMPVFQVSGLLDKDWPVDDSSDIRIRTINYWKAYNNIPAPPFRPCGCYESGLTADETLYEGEDQRFLHHRWFSQDAGKPALYELFLTKRMPHALELRTPLFAWEFLKKFSRNPDGTLTIAE